MSIQDLIQLINTQLPDNNQQLITEAILRGVLGDMVDTLSSELRVFNIESSQVTDNQDSTYSITGVENALVNAIAIDEKLNIFQFDGSVWTLKLASISTDDSLFFEESTREMRSNIGQSTQTFTWNGGAQEFTLVDEPAQIIYISVNGQLLVDINQWSVDVSNKKITINDQLDIGDVINVNYKFIITP